VLEKLLVLSSNITLTFNPIAHAPPKFWNSTCPWRKTAEATRDIVERLESRT
jgi:hypothetical protein